MSKPDCEELIAKLYQFIDGELSRDEAAALKRHLEGCGPCLERIQVEERFKLLIKTKCRGEQVPELLVEKVKAALQAEME